MFLDPVEMLQEFLPEGKMIRVAEKYRQLLYAVRIVGQIMGLLVVDHLNAVFDPAQKPIGFIQLLRGTAIDLTGFGERPQRVAGFSLAQFGNAASPNQLLRLGEKLDFPYAAPAQFDIVSFDGDLGATPVRVDLTLDGMNVLDAGEVEIFAPDKGPKTFKKIFSRLDISRQGPRLDHGGAFPVLPEALIIMFCGHDGDSRRGGSRIGP